MSKMADATELIFVETNKLVETLETSEDKVFKSKNLLEQKQTYLEQLNHHNNETNISFSKKNADLALLNYRVNMVDTDMTTLRNKAKQEYDVYCQEAYKYINNIESDFAECENKFEDLGNKLSNNSVQYDKQIDELITLLNQLTEKRNKKLKSLESQEKLYLDENLDLKNQISYDEKQAEGFGYDDDDSELEMLENELKELQSKLSILDDEHVSLSNESNSLEDASDELSQKYPENKVTELENRYVEINNEVSQITKNMETQSNKELELSNSCPTLEEYEAKLNKEIQETSKFWDDINQDPYQGFSRMEQEISQIQADLIQRNQKFAEAVNSDVGCIEIQQNNKEVGTTGSLVDQLSAELREIEDVFDNLKTSNYFSEQYDVMTKETDELDEEKVNLNDILSKTKNDIKNGTAQMKKEHDKRELDLLATINNALMEEKAIEKDFAGLDITKKILEDKAQYAEIEIKELEETRKKHKEREAGLTIKQQDMEGAVKGAEGMFKMIKTKREGLMAELGNISAPSPIFIKPNNNDTFVKPIAMETSRKKTAVAAPAKRNWDSDSNKSAEEMQISEVLKNKYRKRPGTEYRK